jgi:hypothetical protein
MGFFVSGSFRMVNPFISGVFRPGDWGKGETDGHSRSFAPFTLQLDRSIEGLYKPRGYREAETSPFVLSIQALRLLLKRLEGRLLKRFTHSDAGVLNDETGRPSSPP